MLSISIIPLIVGLCLTVVRFALQGGKRMCGIVGYVGVSDGSKILIEGLKRLEYRGL